MMTPSDWMLPCTGPDGSYYSICSVGHPFLPFPLCYCRFPVRHLLIISIRGRQYCTLLTVSQLLAIYLRKNKQRTVSSSQLLQWIPPHVALASIGPVFTITLRHTTLSRTLLYWWSAHSRDFYLTKHKARKWHPCLRRDSNPRPQQANCHRCTP